MSLHWQVLDSDTQVRGSSSGFLRMWCDSFPWLRVGANHGKFWSHHQQRGWGPLVHLVTGNIYSRMWELSVFLVLISQTTMQISKLSGCLAIPVTAGNWKPWQRQGPGALISGNIRQAPLTALLQFKDRTQTLLGVCASSEKPLSVMGSGLHGLRPRKANHTCQFKLKLQIKRLSFYRQVIWISKAKWGTMHPTACWLCVHVGPAEKSSISSWPDRL